MEAALAPPPSASPIATAATTTATTATRLIEYPDDLSGCDSISYGGRQLLYLCSHGSSGIPFVVVLGFLLGQKQEDIIITKDLIEPVDQDSRSAVREAVVRSIAEEYLGAQIFFL